ncbi:hypothetical protein HKX48_008038 [Thoreauomyces humboldtii]|nr:hypothetical protein HKX48_008038 [Thoreauomyces humboldtii]
MYYRQPPPYLQQQQHYMGAPHRVMMGPPPPGAMAQQYPPYGQQYLGPGAPPQRGPSPAGGPPAGYPGGPPPLNHRQSMMVSPGGPRAHYEGDMGPNGGPPPAHYMVAKRDSVASVASSVSSRSQPHSPRPLSDSSSIVAAPLSASSNPHRESYYPPPHAHPHPRPPPPSDQLVPIAHLHAVQAQLAQCQRKLAEVEQKAAAAEKEPLPETDGTRVLLLQQELDRAMKEIQRLSRPGAVMVAPIIAETDESAKGQEKDGKEGIETEKVDEKEEEMNRLRIELRAARAAAGEVVTLRAKCARLEGEIKELKEEALSRLDEVASMLEQAKLGEDRKGQLQAEAQRQQQHEHQQHDGGPPPAVFQDLQALTEEKAIASHHAALDAL